MADLQYNEDGSVKRDFPVTLVNGDRTLVAHTESDVVAAQWEGFQVQGSAEAKAAAKAAKDESK